MEFNGKVLVVDDEPHIRRYLGLILKKLGRPTVFEAGTGEAALALYDEHQPDLVLMDVNMPGMDGLEALQKLLAAHPDALVIMLTSLSNRSVVERCIEIGAINFVRKDTPKEMISRVLSETIETYWPEHPEPPA